MNRSLIFYSIIYLLFTLCLNVKAQRDIEVKLGGNTEDEAFYITDSDGNILFICNGIGFVGVGTDRPNNNLCVVAPKAGDGISVVNNDGDTRVLLSMSCENGFIELRDDEGNYTHIRPEGLRLATGSIIRYGDDWFIHNSGRSNFFAGVNAGYQMISGTGTGNTATGKEALYSNTRGFRNTAIGNAALYYNEGSDNTATGKSALYSNTEGEKNTANGSYALYNNLTGPWNTAIGSHSLYNNRWGGGNTAVGEHALFSNTEGDANTAMGVKALDKTTGSDNTAYGNSALWRNTTGDGNTAIGRSALKYNTTGSNNTAIGFKADVGSGDLTNATAIGANAVVSTSNSIVLGGTGTNAVNVGIGTSAPTTALEVNGDLLLSDGSTIIPKHEPGYGVYSVNRVAISEIIEITGTLNAESRTDIILPDGWTANNVRVLCLEVHIYYPGSECVQFHGCAMYNLFGECETNSPTYQIVTEADGRSRLVIYHEHYEHNSKPFRAVLMKINPQ